MNTPNSERVHIAFFGCRNAGKSSLLNRVIGQDLAVVSDTAGTTTDPVQKAMELLPLGPVLIIDTPGYDDAGVLGSLRVEKTQTILRKTDIAVLVIDATQGLREADKRFKAFLKEQNIPHLVVYNKADLAKTPSLAANEIAVSALQAQNIEALKTRLAELKPNKAEKWIVADKLPPQSCVIMVCPIDAAAPKGRLILPQQQTLRELLDFHCKVLVCRESELQSTLDGLKNPPNLVICDSQVFKICANIVPKSVPLTSFSILMARYKGVLKYAVQGVTAIERLKDGASVLIAEGCTHHRQCGDIGTVKLPNLIQKKTQKTFRFSFTSGGTFPENLDAFGVVVHCGGCMLNDREMESRMACAQAAGIAMTNYGILIAHLNGILERSLEIFPEIQSD